MKNLKFILFLAISITMLSCSDDDDSSGPELTTANLAGTYDLNFFEYTETSTTLLNGVEVTSTSREVGDTFTNSTIVFNTNGTFSINFQYRVTETITVEGTEISEDVFITEDEDSGTFSVNEENETITFDGDEIADVVRFNGDELRIEFNETFIDGDITGTDFTEFRFERQ